MTQTCGDTRDRASARRVRTTDYLGNRVTVLHYEWQGKRVREWPDGSMLIELRAGRFRDFNATHWMCQTVRGEIDLSSPFTQALHQINAAGRRFAQGTHEPVTYYRRANGDIGVPPEPGMEPPDDVTVHTFNTLGEADRLAREMRSQMYREFQDDGSTTEALDDLFEFNRSQLTQAMAEGRGRKGREIARLMLEDLDREADDRQRINTNAFFHYREYDR